MNKTKGANAERELLHMLEREKWKAVRVAGSGMIEETACDLIMSHGLKKKQFIVECKTCKDKKRYLEKQQIEELKKFAIEWGAPPVLAVKFSRQGWWFIEPEKLEDTGKGLAISLEDIQKIGISFDDFIR